jgi:hypothetical protein
MIHEAFIDALSAKKVIFRINGDAEGYQQILFENGALVIQCKSNNLWTNISNISNTKIEELIPGDGTTYSYL